MLNPLVAVAECGLSSNAVRGEIVLVHCGCKERERDESGRMTKPNSRKVEISRPGNRTSAVQLLLAGKCMSCCVRVI